MVDVAIITERNRATASRVAQDATLRERLPVLVNIVVGNVITPTRSLGCYQDDENRERHGKDLSVLLSL